MTKTPIEHMTRYLKRMNGKWKLDEDPFQCDLCDWATTEKQMSHWIKIGDNPYLCSKHARELDLLW